MNKITRKDVRIIGIIVYLILIILSLYYYKERTIFTDIAFHLYYLLKDGDFAIQNYRFIAFITQSFPLMGRKLALSLEQVMQLYSLAFVLLPMTVFLLLSFVLKSKKMALALLLFSVGMVTHTFYWIQSEFQQGIVVLFLYFGLLGYGQEKGYDLNNNFWFFPIKTAILLALIFAHPLIIFPFGFITLFLILHQKANQRFYLNEGLTFLGLYLIKFIFFKTSYDTQSSEGLSNFLTYFPNYLDLRSNLDFLRYLVKDYYLLVVGLTISGAYYYSKKQWMKLGLLMSAFGGYLLLVNVSYPRGAEQYYIENLYLPLSIFVIFPLVFDILPVVKWKFLKTVLITIIILRIGHIAWCGNMYTKRLDYLTTILEETAEEDTTKQIIKEKPAHQRALFMTWATSYEFWLLSTLDTGTSRSLMITDRPDDYRWLLPAKNKFVTPWGELEYVHLNKRYFNFTDTSAYRIVE